MSEQDAASHDGLTLAQREYRASLVASGVLSMLTSSKQSHKLFTVWFANWVYEQQRQPNGDPPSGAASDVDWLNWTRLALESGVCSSPLLRDAAARVKAGLEGSRGTGTSSGVTCVITGVPTLIVHASLDIAGELSQACVHVMGLTFVAYEVGDEVHVGELSVASKSHNTYSGQCVIKSDAVSDLVATRCRVTNKALAARSTQYLESIFEEAMSALDHLGPMGVSVSIEEAEAREHISDRKYFTEADVHYTTVLGGAHRTRDVLRYDTSHRRKIIVTARCAGAMMRVLVVDGQLFGQDDNSWVTYQLLYDHHCRPMVPVDVQYDGHSGSERFLAHAKSMQIDVIHRNELDWRDLGGRADATLVPVSTFHSVHGDRIRVRTPDPALSTVGRGAWGFDGDTVCWRGGRGVTLPMFQTCPTKLTEWLQRFTPPQPLNPEPDGDASPSPPPTAFTGASVLVVCKRGVILGKSRHTGIWEDFGGARDESRSERPYDTAVRELTEESGLKPCDLDFGQRDPVMVSHAGHVHAVFVACMRDTGCRGSHGAQSAFVVAPSGRVQSTAETDGELTGFICLRSFDDYFASELKGQLIHRRIKDARVMELAASVYRGLQAAAEVGTDGSERHGGGFTTAVPSAVPDPGPAPAPAPAPAAPSAASDPGPAPAPAPPPAPAPASAPAPAPAPVPPAADGDDGHGSVCYTDGCSRPSRLTARFFDDDGVEHTRPICCFQCVTGEGHSSECDAASASWRQRRLRRRLRGGVGHPARHSATAPTSTAPTSTAPKSAAPPAAAPTPPPAAATTASGDVSSHAV